MKNNLSNNLTALRINNKLSQEDLSDKLNVSRPRYSAWEEGRNEPSVGSLLNISSFYKISLDDLICNSAMRISNIQQMKQIYKYIVVIILLAVAFFLGKCEWGVVKESLTTEPIKERVVYLKADQHKLKDTIIYRERIRTKYVVMWKEVRHDSLIPCETKLLVCDTIIRADSAVIIAQKAVISKSDIIIATQDSIIKMDSLTIGGLRKENKKLKRNNKILTWLNIGQAALNVGQAVRRD